MEKAIIQSRQRWVLRHPCRTVQECGQVGYRADWNLCGNHVATVLTIDLFTEPLAWHADVAIIGDDRKAKPVALWSASDRIAALDLAARMLEGVGASDRQTVDADSLRLGLIRPLTIREQALVLAIADRRPLASPLAIGELNEFDFSDFDTEVDEGLFVSQRREIIYG